MYSWRLQSVQCFMKRCLRNSGPLWLDYGSLWKRGIRRLQARTCVSLLVVGHDSSGWAACSPPAGPDARELLWKHMQANEKSGA